MCLCSQISVHPREISSRLLSRDARIQNRQLHRVFGIRISMRIRDTCAMHAVPVEYVSSRASNIVPVLCGQPSWAHRMLDHSPVPDLASLLQQIDHRESKPAPVQEAAQQGVRTGFRAPEIAVLVAVTAGVTSTFCRLLSRGRPRRRVRPTIVCPYS